MQLNCKSALAALLTVTAAGVLAAEESGPILQVANVVALQDVDPVQEQAQPGMLDAIDMDALDDEPEIAEEEGEEEEGRYNLFNPFWGIQISGHISSGIYQNGDRNHRGFGNQPLGFRNIADGYTLDQAWITAERAIDPDCCCWDWGFRMDYIWGVDGPDTNAFGDQSVWDFRWNSNRRASGQVDYAGAMPQMYAQFGKGNFNVKAGHFFTIIGYEVVSAPDNFFYSHAYTMFYGEPFTHTGVLAETKLMCDQLTVWAGWTNGWDSYFGNHLHGSTFLGGASYAVSDNLTATWTVTTGDFGDGTPRRSNDPTDGNSGKIYMQSIVVDWVINDCLEYVFQSDYGNNWDLAAQQENVEWYGVNQYLFYTLSDCWRAGARFEWFDDVDGQRVGFGDSDYYALTLGLNYTPNSNLIVRPEVRWDFADGATPFNPNGAGVGQDDNQVYYGFDVIVLY